MCISPSSRRCLPALLLAPNQALKRGKLLSPAVGSPRYADARQSVAGGQEETSRCKEKRPIIETTEWQKQTWVEAEQLPVAAHVGGWVHTANDLKERADNVFPWWSLSI